MTTQVSQKDTSQIVWLLSGGCCAGAPLATLAAQSGQTFLPGCVFFKGPPPKQAGFRLFFWFCSSPPKKRRRRRTKSCSVSLLVSHPKTRGGTNSHKKPQVVSACPRLALKASGPRYQLSAPNLFQPVLRPGHLSRPRRFYFFRGLVRAQPR